MELTNFIHPSNRIVGTEGEELRGKVIVFGITGSVAAIKSIEAIRLLMRHGATVIPVVSSAALKLITTESLHWASGHEPIQEITGLTEHILYAGVEWQKADAMIIYPSTASTISKLAHGIFDTSVTLMAGTAIGNGIPVLMFPAMHAAMYHNPSINENIQKLKQMNVRIVEPDEKEGKAKIPMPEEVVARTIKLLTPQFLENKRVIVTAGPTREPIDDVRFITNYSSGKMGYAFARAAWEAGAEVYLVTGPTHEQLELKEIKKYSVQTTAEMTHTVLEIGKEKNIDLVILAAAMADFQPIKREGKTKSGQDITLELTSTPKLSDQIRAHFPKAHYVVFKAEYNVSKEELLTAAESKRAEVGADYVITNDLAEQGAGFEDETNHIYLLSRSGTQKELKGRKIEIARKVLREIARELTEEGEEDEK